MATAPRKEIKEINNFLITAFFHKYNFNHYYPDTIAESYQIVSLWYQQLDGYAKSIIGQAHPDGDPGVFLMKRKEGQPQL